MLLGFSKFFAVKVWSFSFGLDRDMEDNYHAVLIKELSVLTAIIKDGGRFVV